MDIFRIRPVLALLSVLFAVTSILGSQTSSAEPASATIISTSVLCKQPDRYIGWPTVAKTADGELLVAFSGDRQEHVCPWGKTQMVRSGDGGVTWSAPETVNNTPLDDRDAGVLVTRKGTLVVSWFTSLAFTEPVYKKHYPRSVVDSWQRHIEKLNTETREKWLGCWVRRSTDGGKTWGEHIRTQGNAPHGPIELANGKLLYVGKTLWDDKQTLSVEESGDDGLTWKRIGSIDVAPGENINHYHELHAVELANGKIIAMIRYNPPERENNIMRQSESTDGGKTWTTPHPTGIWGYPPHMIRLRDDRLVVVYGHRREPFSERACISYDNGETWDVENSIEIAPAMNSDLGYPASVEMDDGSIFTVYYQIDKEGEKTCLMGTRWKLSEAGNSTGQKNGINAEEYLKKKSGTWRDLNVPDTDGRILHDLIVKNGYTRALEIGTSTGHSGIWIAWALSKTGGKLTTIEIDEGRHREALRNFNEAGVINSIDARLGDAHEIVPELDGPYDFIFVDADKSWYSNYLKFIEPKLVTGGCFTAHNVLNTNLSGINEFLENLTKYDNLTTTINSSGSGLSISYKK